MTEYVGPVIPTDPTAETIEQVRQLILEFDPNEADTMEDEYVKLATYYVHYNGYLEEIGEGTAGEVYHVYDVLKWTGQNL